MPQKFFNIIVYLQLILKETKKNRGRKAIKSKRNFPQTYIVFAE